MTHTSNKSLLLQQTSCTPFNHEVLAPELWAEIFLQYAVAINEYQYVSRPWQQPWRIGQVCRYWRHIALCTPRLWNTIVVTAPYRDKGHEQLRELLIRSSNVPLFLVAPKLLSPGDLDRLPEVWDLLLQHHERWENVEIGCWTPHIQEQFAATHTAFHRLTAITIGNREFFFTLGKERRIFAFHYASQLKHVTIKVYPVSWSLIEKLPWSQLESYAQSGYEKQQFPYNEILQAAPKLLKLAVPMPSFPLTNVVFTHLRLRELILESSDQGSLTNLVTWLKDITLPALQKLALNMRRDSVEVGPSTTQSLISLLMRSQCSLKELTIDSHNCLSAEDIALLLQCTLYLEKLVLGNCTTSTEYDSHPAFASMFICEEGAPVLLPYLSSLVLKYCGASPSDFVTLSKVVSSRSEIPSDYIPGQTIARVLANVRLELNSTHYFGPLCALEDVDTNHLQELFGNGPWMDCKQSLETEEWHKLQILDIINSCLSDERERKTYGRRYIFALLDYILHTRFFYRNWKGEVLASLDENFVSYLDSELRHRKWMLVGQDNVLYISPNHKIRSSQLDKRNLVVGASKNWIPYLMGDEDFPPPFGELSI